MFDTKRSISRTPHRPDATRASRTDQGPGDCRAAPEHLSGSHILDEKSWDIMGYYGRQWNDPAPAPRCGRRRDRTVRTSLTALKLKDLLPRRLSGAEGRPSRLRRAMLLFRCRAANDAPPAPCAFNFGSGPCRHFSRIPSLSPMSCPRPIRTSAKTAGAPDMILLHYTGMPTGEAALTRLCAPDSKVSSHYVVFEDGRIVQCVPEAIARLARRRVVLGRGDRHQFVLDRHRDRQSGP